MNVPLALTVRRPVRTCRLRLLVLPYAGGSSAMSAGWQDVLPGDVELVDVDLPARGGRIREPPLTTLDEYLDRLVLAHTTWLADRPLAIYGHSLGAIVGYELARRLVAQGAAPAVLAVSGRAAPHVRSARPVVHGLPREAFLQALRDLDGTPEEVLENPELIDLLLPAIRADFAISERYEYAPGEPLATPLAVFAGEHDGEVPPGDAETWRCHTTTDFSCEYVPGGHFFPITHAGSFLPRLAAVIRAA